MTLEECSAIPDLAHGSLTKALIEVVLALVPELLAANKVDLPPGVAEIPIDVIAERHAVARLMV